MCLVYLLHVNITTNASSHIRQYKCIYIYWGFWNRLFIVSIPQMIFLTTFSRYSIHTFCNNLLSLRPKLFLESHQMSSSFSLKRAHDRTESCFPWIITFHVLKHSRDERPFARRWCRPRTLPIPTSTILPDNIELHSSSSFFPPEIKLMKCFLKESSELVPFFQGSPFSSSLPMVPHL